MAQERYGLHDNVWGRPFLRRRLLKHWKPASGARLNLGCGADYKPGWTNLDFHSPQADVRHNLSKSPWPFANDAFDWIFADQVFEHLPPTNAAGEDQLIAALLEVQRILRPGGRLYIGVPYGGSKTDFAQITHYRHFVKNSFNFLLPQSESLTASKGWLDRLSLRFRAVLRGLPGIQLPLNVGKAEELVFILEKKR